MTKPFQPARIVGGSIVAETMPFAFEASARYRGAEILEHAPARPVVVREPHEHVVDDIHFIELFQRTVSQTAALAGSAAPEVLHVLGRDGIAHALVEEDVSGLRCNTLLEELRSGGTQLPVEVALAIAAELTGLWWLPIERGTVVELHIGIDDILITADGRVRATPQLASERARQIVGAMAMAIEGNVGYLSPEQIEGRPLEMTSSMFTFGLLLYELLATRHPVDLAGRPMMAVLSHLRTVDFPPIEHRRPVPPDLAAFLARTTALDPAARFPSWVDLVGALETIRASLPPVGPAELLRAVPLRPPPARTIDPRTVADWRALPHDGLVPIDITAPRVPRSPPRPRGTIDLDFVYPPHTDGRPMLAVGHLLVDVQPVTAAELARFALATHRPPLPNRDDVPATLVSFVEASAYAAWAGKRLPSEAEWHACVSALGSRLGTGAVWEWTTTPEHAGHVVRGGRWRNALERPPHPDNRSFETEPAADVGFRCVRDSR